MNSRAARPTPAATVGDNTCFSTVSTTKTAARAEAGREAEVLRHAVRRGAGWAGGDRGGFKGSTYYYCRRFLSQLSSRLVRGARALPQSECDRVSLSSGDTRGGGQSF